MFCFLSGCQLSRTIFPYDIHHWYFTRYVSTAVSECNSSWAIRIANTFPKSLVLFLVYWRFARHESSWRWVFSISRLEAYRRIWSAVCCVATTKLGQYKESSAMNIIDTYMCWFSVATRYSHKVGDCFNQKTICFSKIIVALDPHGTRGDKG